MDQKRGPKLEITVEHDVFPVLVVDFLVHSWVNKNTLGDGCPKPARAVGFVAEPAEAVADRDLYWNGSIGVSWRGRCWSLCHCATRNWYPPVENQECRLDNPLFRMIFPAINLHYPSISKLRSGGFANWVSYWGGWTWPRTAWRGWQVASVLVRSWRCSICLPTNWGSCGLEPFRLSDFEGVSSWLGKWIGLGKIYGLRSTWISESWVLACVVCVACVACREATFGELLAQLASAEECQPLAESGLVLQPFGIAPSWRVPWPWPWGYAQCGNWKPWHTFSNWQLPQPTHALSRTGMLYGENSKNQATKPLTSLGRCEWDVSSKYIQIIPNIYIYMHAHSLIIFSTSNLHLLAGYLVVRVNIIFFVFDIHLGWWCFDFFGFAADWLFGGEYLLMDLDLLEELLNVIHTNLALLGGFNQRVLG